MSKNKKRYNFLKNFNPEDTQSATALSEIITLTEKLKNKKKIEEKHIGLFASQQEDSYKNKLLALIGCQKAPYNNPQYVGVFFEKLAQYNNNIKKKSFISPTPQQFALYKDNQQKIALFNKTQSFNLYLNTQYTEEKPHNILATNLATTEFEKLLMDITILQNEFLPNEIEEIAHSLYGNNTENEQINAAEKL